MTPVDPGPKDRQLVVVVDCSDLSRSAEFWGSILGYKPQGEPGGPYRSLVPSKGTGIEVLLQEVPETKAGKNRLHVDLRCRDLEGELDRAKSIGARQLTAEPIFEDGWLWYVLADPDGNEFCVVQPPAEYWED